MAEELTFAAGTLVRLNSGGPSMTIYGDKDGQGEYYCMWWNPKEYKMDGARINPSALTEIGRVDEF